MKELRLTIPLIGGPTLILTKEEVEQKKVAIKQSMSSLNSTVKAFSKKAWKESKHLASCTATAASAAVEGFKLQYRDRT